MTSGFSSIFFYFSSLLTSLSYDLIKSKVVSLVKWCFKRESKTYICTSNKAGVLHVLRSMTLLKVGFALSYVKLLLPSWKIYIYGQSDGMVYQQMVEIPIGTNCAPLIGLAVLFSYCYEGDIMTNLQKFKRFNLMDKFNFTSRYLDEPSSAVDFG